METGILEKVKEVLNSGVKRRVNAEFMRRVEEDGEEGFNEDRALKECYVAKLV